MQPPPAAVAPVAAVPAEVGPAEAAAPVGWEPAVAGLAAVGLVAIEEEIPDKNKNTDIKVVNVFALKCKKTSITIYEEHVWV